MNRNEQTPLFDALVHYIDLRPTYLRVPGHRFERGINQKWIDFAGENIFKFDVTETAYTDDLHNPSGPIKEAQQLASEVFGADHSYFLINGTTCGNEAMVATTALAGDEILIPRNAHKSILMGLIISGATPIYIRPEVSPEWGLYGGLNPAEIRSILDTHPNCKSVFAVSPTYYGLCCDIRSIAEICHEKAIPLIVDEAHGAHCYFSDSLPNGAITNGADLATQSIHKVTGSLTQSSMLHMKSSLVNRALLEANLHIVQSTSPSYLLMASLDLARQELATQGEEMIANALSLAGYARSEINNIKGIRCLSDDIVGTSSIYALDRTRLTITAKALGLTGFRLKDILFNRYNIDMELSDYTNALALVSFANTKQDMDRLINALNDIAKTTVPGTDVVINDSYTPEIPPYAISPREAHFSPKRTIPWKEARGCIAGELIAPYPPGIPVIYPGEILTDEIWEFLNDYKHLGMHLHGPVDSDLNNYQIIDL